MKVKTQKNKERTQLLPFSWQEKTDLNDSTVDIPAPMVTHSHILPL